MQFRNCDKTLYQQCGYSYITNCSNCPQALDKMENEWKPVLLEVMEYKDTGTFIMKVGDDCTQLLDDHIVMAQSMSFSPYKKPFEERISTWEGKLVMTQDVMDEWLQCQRAWLYLEPIFSSEDINRQLPVESKRYQTMERIWRKVMKQAKDNPQVCSKYVRFLPGVHLQSQAKSWTELAFSPFSPPPPQSSVDL